MGQNFLDCDPSILFRNLSIQKEPDFPDYSPQLLSERVNKVSIIPKPGFCLKARKENGEKVFINVCHTNEVPEGDPISDEDFMKIVNLEQPYVFPISLGGVHYETSKRKEVASVYDVAINTNFFHRVEANDSFRSLICQMVFSAVEEKYSLSLPPEGRSMLKRRSCFGTIRSQLIEKRPVKKIPKCLIEDLGDVPSLPAPDSVPSPTTSPISSGSPLVKVDHEIRKEPKPKRGNGLKLTEEEESGRKIAVGYISVEAKSAKDLSLFVGEDRIVLQNDAESETVLDFFLPLKLNAEETVADFNISEKTLRIKVPFEASKD